MTINNEFTSWDFGFTAVDNPDEIVRPVQPVIKSEDFSGPILERIEVMNQKIDELTDMLERLEQAGTPDLDTDEYKSLIEKDVRDKLKKVEQMVMPLLTNLLKDADNKDYIKWPNKRVVIESFIDKFLAITRS